MIKATYYWIGQTEDVFEFLDGEQSPLYGMGFDRWFRVLAGGDYWESQSVCF